MVRFISRGTLRNPLASVFIQAGAQAGYRVTKDYNGEQQEGFCPMDTTIWRGWRWSAANAYLRPGLRTGRVKIVRGLAMRLVFEWELFKTGLGASNHFEAGGFIRSKAGVEYPDIQFHFLPIAVRYDGYRVSKGHGFQIHVGPMRSPSRGAVSP